MAESAYSEPLDNDIPFNEYPDSGHVQLQLYETRRVSITSQPYRNACKMSKEKNFRQFKRDPRGDEYPPVKNNDVVEYYIKKRITKREENRALPEYQYIASRNPIHQILDIQNWDPNGWEPVGSFPVAEPEPTIGRNVFDTTLGVIYCSSSRAEHLWMSNRQREQKDCGIGELLVQACLNDHEHVLSAALSDNIVFGAEGNERGIQGGVRNHKRQRCQDFVEVVLRDQAQRRERLNRRVNHYWLIIYLRGALRSNYGQLITLQKSCVPFHKCGPNDRNCVADSSWVIYETQHVIDEYEGYQRGDRALEFNFWIEISTRIIADRWYFCRRGLGL